MEVDTCQSKGATKVSEYNYARLKHVLQDNMITASAEGYKQNLCTRCLQIKFGVGRKWPRKYFRDLINKRKAIRKRKEELNAELNFDVERIVLPFEAETRSKNKYFSDLGDGDLVHVLPRASFSNAAGKQIGNAAIYSHTNFLFNKWVLANSTPNGRTKEGHGAMRFLDPVLDMIAPSIGGLDRR